MPYPHKFNRVAFGGTLSTSSEEWQCGFNFGLIDSDAGALDEGALAEMYDIIAEELIAPTSTRINGAPGSSLRMEWIKSNLVNTDGTQAPGIFYDGATPVAGSGTSNQWNQVSMVVSMGGTRGRGPASRGRFYVPNVGGPVTNDGHVGTVVATNLALSAQAMINRLNTELTEFFQYVILASPGGVTGAGAMQRVTTIRVGNVVDTQRRRRNQLTESYTVQPIT